MYRVRDYFNIDKEILSGNPVFKGTRVNGLMDNLNIVKLQKQIDENNNTRILFGGAAITKNRRKVSTALGTDKNGTQQ